MVRINTSQTIMFGDFINVFNINIYSLEIIIWGC